MEIQELELSTRCTNSLKNVGVETVEQLEEVLKLTVGRGGGIARWFYHMREIIQQMKLKGQWSEELEELYKD